jgi:hypothetical protein
MKLVQRTVYFRPEDVELWNAIDNKAQWLHERLKADVYGTPSIFKKSATKSPRKYKKYDGKKIETVSNLPTDSSVEPKPKPIPNIPTDKDGYGFSIVEKYLGPQVFDKPLGKCGHVLDDRGKCLTKGCKVK